MICLTLVALHGMVYPVMALGLPDLFESRLYLSMMNLGDLPDCEQQTIVVVNAPGGQWALTSFTVTVTDGRLDLQFSDLGGDPYWVLNGLRVVGKDIAKARGEEI